MLSAFGPALQVDRLRALLLPAKPAAGEGKDKKGHRRPQVGRLVSSRLRALHPGHMEQDVIRRRECVQGWGTAWGHSCWN